MSCHVCYNSPEEVMLMALATMSVRVDAQVKKQVESFCSDVGISPSAAVNMFFKAMLRENRIPFEIRRDPFYSEENQARLRKSIAQMEASGGTIHSVEAWDDHGLD